VLIDEIRRPAMKKVTTTTTKRLEKLQRLTIGLDRSRPHQSGSGSNHGEVGLCFRAAMLHWTQQLRINPRQTSQHVQLLSTRYLCKERSTSQGRSVPTVICGAGAESGGGRWKKWEEASDRGHGTEASSVTASPLDQWRSLRTAAQ
jgi:hypothetical protein